MDQAISIKMEENISHALNSGTLFLPRDNPAQRSPFLMGLQSSQGVDVDNDCVWCTLAALMNVSVLQMVNFTEQIHFSPHGTAMYPQQIDMILAQIEMSFPETRYGNMYLGEDLIMTSPETNLLRLQDILLPLE